jgi:metal-responsive CopG/Arc/MetJ family transcriptional regulator
MAMKKVTVAMTDEMYDDLEKIRKQKRLSSVAETARVVIGDYLSSSTEDKRRDL